jgi:hypothetical protein
MPFYAYMMSIFGVDSSLLDFYCLTTNETTLLFEGKLTYYGYIFDENSFIFVYYGEGLALLK